MGVGDEVARLKATGVNIRIEPGICTGFEWLTKTAIVNIGGGTIRAQMAGVQPLVGRPVWVIITDTVALCIGKTAGPAMGTVTVATAGGFTTITGDDGVSYSVGGEFGVSYAVGNRVLLDWDAGGHIIQRVSAEIPGITGYFAPPPPSGGGAAIGGDTTFFATETRSWRSGGGSSNDVYFASSWTVGAWFYGAQIANTIPDGAVIDLVQIYIRALSASGGVNPSLGTHDRGDTSAGAPPITNLTAVSIAPGFEGWVNLPNSFGDLLKVGTMFGIGTTGAGYRVFQGLPFASSGALHIKWH